ncbi:phage recombination protein Bet [Cryptobacterium curtum DSM 15641]|uniref:Phage recombination protein Bet n=1 Tax=Cryptobacterium curtum (strain ATCC 700683 / DSM 15641 / CCUG 43107 / 12-3) TaxID=469378 RepID=C7MM83_CRYCD|nr:phage recombination protein Bet [Cryptobacterium curtum]ACU94023.1 phage recombination protein Bet [Cryptobacterium curtum DSM 15641]
MPQEIAKVEYTAADGQEVRLTPGVIAKYIVSGNGLASEKDIYSFMARCQARGLNPLAGDAYMTVYQGKDGNTSSSVIVSKDYFVRTATAQDSFDGMEAGVTVLNGQGQIQKREGCEFFPSLGEKLLGGWAKVHVKDREHPSKAAVTMDEYDQHRSLWKSKPATMIRKVAIVQALREAYPGQFGGVYDRDEMPPSQEPQQVPVEVYEAPEAYETPDNQNRATEEF